MCSPISYIDVRFSISFQVLTDPRIFGHRRDQPGNPGRKGNNCNQLYSLGLAEDSRCVMVSREAFS
jgi:hypothetical protein